MRVPTNLVHPHDEVEEVHVTLGSPPIEQVPPETHNEDSSDDDGKSDLADTGTRHGC